MTYKPMQTLLAISMQEMDNGQVEFFLTPPQILSDNKKWAKAAEKFLELTVSTIESSIKKQENK